MSLPRLFVLFVVVLFTLIGIGAILKKGKPDQPEVAQTISAAPQEVELERQTKVVELPKVEVAAAPAPVAEASPPKYQEDLPEVDRVAELFNKKEPRFPFVDTITYQSRVAWQKGRPAWLSDYASHYQTSRHFIARSLNGKPDYFKQDVADGERFNVLKSDLSFYLLIDATRCKMWFFAINGDNKERTLIKTYNVGLGRLDKSKASGMLTPLGKYTLGNKIAIYKPKMVGFHNGEKVEMIRIFGTRWIPFEKELGNNTASAKGFGIHGVPWLENGSGELVQDNGSIGKYESDGCIRLLTADMEELFSIIITKPTTLELVKDYHEATF
jgi:hypothetical protein